VRGDRIPKPDSIIRRSCSSFAQEVRQHLVGVRHLTFQRLELDDGAHELAVFELSYHRVGAVATEAGQEDDGLAVQLCPVASVAIQIVQHGRVVDIRAIVLGNA
jgi:hypothetical protein